MAFREVRVFEIREVLRLWLRGEGVRATERLAGVDRKTVRRYQAAAEALGLVGTAVRSSCRTCSWARWWRRSGRTGRTVEGTPGVCWSPTHEQIATWLKIEQLTVVKVGELLARRGIVVPARTLHRYALEVGDVGRGRLGTTAS